MLAYQGRDLKYPEPVEVTLVPKLQLGNPEAEAPASQDWKLELPRVVDLSGYAGANPIYAMGVAKSVNREMKDA